MAQNILINPPILTNLLEAADTRASIGRMAGASEAMMMVELARSANGPVLVLANDPRHADQIEAESRWFAGDDLPVSAFRRMGNPALGQLLAAPGHRVTTARGARHARHPRKGNCHCVESSAAAALAASRLCICALPAAVRRGRV